MIKILTNSGRIEFSDLFKQMFRGRAAVFHERLRWDVRISAGMEIDRYDEESDPVYLVSIDAAGRMHGSLRLLPTTGETMLRNEFANFFTEPVDVSSPTAWECTRFCVHSDPSHETSRQVSSELLIGLCELAIESGIEQIIGLYDERMTRVYRRIGWSPAPLAVSRPEIGKLVVGIWDASQEALQAMKLRAAEATNRNLNNQNNQAA
jgi:N-acyl-L-homoserine lactone synthetase